MSQRKVCLVIGHAQSNEAASGNKFGAAAQATTPVTYESLSAHHRRDKAAPFEVLADKIARRTGWIVDVFNYAVSGSSIGAATIWPGLASGTGATAVVLRPGAAGYDPNGYIANTIAGVTTAVNRGFEPWHIQMLAGNDQGVAPSALATGLSDITTQALAAGATKSFLGIVHGRSGSGQNTSYFDNTEPYHSLSFYEARRQFLANFAGNPKVYAGADLGQFHAAANSQANSYKTDGETHLNYMGVLHTASMWLTRLEELGLLEATE